MEQENNFNEQDALRLIESTIKQARNKINENGFVFLLWGWLVILGNICGYYWHTQGNGLAIGITWMTLSIAGGITTGIYFTKREKVETTKSYIDDFLKYLWSATLIGGGIFYFYLIAFGPRILIAPFVFIVIGIATLVTGRLLKFKPLIFGGISFWIFAAISLFLQAEWQFIIGAAAMIPGYLIPGYLLRNQFKPENV